MQTGYIYKLCCTDIEVKEIYVGSTKNLKNRKCTHKNACNKIGGRAYNVFVYQHIRANGGFQNWDMVLLETVRYDARAEVLARERYWVELLGATLNKVIPGRTKQEYRDAHKEEHRQYDKQYYVDNKEHKEQYQKRYIDEHKEAVGLYQQRYRDAHKEETKQYDKQYCINNREAIAQRARRYREKNREAISQHRSQPLDCTCGKKYTRNHRLRHERSNHHQRWQDLFDFIHS
jgi:hypothetical protein